MKIVHVTWMFTFGGIETMLVNICNEQIKLGHDVHLIVMEDSTVESTLYDSLDKRIKLHYGHRKNGANLLLPMLRLNYLLYELHPNVIHIHSSSMYKLILAPWHKKITNATLHALPKPKNTQSIDLVPRVFAISDSVRRALLAYNGTESICNPNGIRPELIKQRQSGDWKDMLQIVQVGRLDHDDKGQHILIQAGAELLKRGYHNFMINFIGDGSSRPYLEGMVQKSGLGQNVTFHGMKSQSYIVEHVCDYDVFVQPSIREGFGNTVAEAMAAKVAVVVSSGQGPEEVIDYGKYGYVFKNGNPIDCADKLEVFLKHENDQQQVEAAYKRVLDLYDIKVTVKTYLDKYKRR